MTTHQDSAPAFTAPGTARPADDDTTPSTRPSLLDDLRAEAKREVSNAPITLVTPNRKGGWAIRYDTNVDDHLLGRWRKSATDKQMPEGIDQLKLCKTVLANHAEVFLKDGVEAVDEAGEPISFKSQWLLTELGVGRPIDAVQKWYGVDGHIISDAYEVLEAAGFGKDAEREDPTPRS